jgi:hypothetical protein
VAPDIYGERSAHVDLQGDAMVATRGFAILTVLLLAGCSVHVSAGSAPPDDLRTPAAASPSTVPNLPSPIVVTPASALPARFTADQLTGALLTQADLAPGWTIGTSESNSTGLPKTGCPPLDAINRWPAAKAIVGFVAGDGNSQLVEALSSMPEKSASEMIHTSSTMRSECLTITLKDNAGRSYTQDVTRPRFPRLGDETDAVRIGSPKTYYFTTVLIRRGGLVLTVGSVSREAETPLLEPFARAALAKVDSKLR